MKVPASKENQIKTGKLMGCYQIKKTGFLYVSLLLLCFVAKTLHADVNVAATISQKQATLEDDLELIVTIEGSKSATEPVLPSIPAFKVIPQGTSSSIQIVNGTVSIQKQFHYVLMPQNEGTHTIPAITVFIDGREYQTKSIVVTIGKSSVGNQKPAPGIGAYYGNAPGPITPPGFAHNPQADTGTADNIDDRPYWITTQISKTSPYVNEQIIFTFKFYTSINVGNATLTLPELKDFWMEEIVPEKKYYETINGRKFVVSEKKLALFPLRSGSLPIDDTILKVEVPDESRRSAFEDPFFFGIGRQSMKVKNLRAKGSTLEVSPLPLGAPKNYSNLVGKFELESKLSNTEQIKVGDSVTLDFKIKGAGNIKDAVIPKLEANGDFKFYEDKPIVDIVRKETGIEGSKAFKVAIVPSHKGEMKIPSLALSFFNPASGEYEELHSETSSVNIIPNEQESLNIATAETNAKSPDKGGNILDIASIHTDFDLNNSKDFPLFFFLLFLTVPPFLYGLIRLVIFSKNKVATNEYRARGALKVFLDRIDKSRGTASLQLRSGEVLETVRKYVGEKCHIFGASLTAGEMAGILEKKGVGRDLTATLSSFISDLESLSYGSGLGNRSLDELVCTVKDLISQIDKKIS